jgi:hypothetical protein
VRSGALLSRLRHDRRQHESGNVAKPTFAIRLAPGEQQLAGNPMPTPSPTPAAEPKNSPRLSAAFPQPTIGGGDPVNNFKSRRVSVRSSIPTISYSLR